MYVEMWQRDSLHRLPQMPTLSMNHLRNLVFPERKEKRQKKTLKRRSSTGSLQSNSKSFSRTPVYSTRQNTLLLSPGEEVDLAGTKITRVSKSPVTSSTSFIFNSKASLFRGHVSKFFQAREHRVRYIPRSHPAISRGLIATIPGFQPTISGTFFRRSSDCKDFEAYIGFLPFPWFGW